LAHVRQSIRDNVVTATTGLSTTGRCTGKVYPSGDLQEVECSLDVNPFAGSAPVQGDAKIGGTVSKIEVRGWDDPGRIGPWSDLVIAKALDDRKVIEPRRKIELERAELAQKKSKN